MATNKKNLRKKSEYTTTEKVVKTIFLVLVWAMIGLYTEITGTTQKDLILKTNSNYELVSRAISGRSFGYFIGSFLGGPLVDKLEKFCDLMIAICLIGAAIATAVVPYSPDVSILGVLLIVGGTFEGVINIAGQKLILNIWKERAAGPLHILHFGFGMGSFMVPQIANPFLAVIAQQEVNATSTINASVTTSTGTPILSANSSKSSGMFLKESRIEAAYFIVAFIVAGLSLVVFTVFLVVYQFCCVQLTYSHLRKKQKESKFRKIVNVVDPATCTNGDRMFGIQLFSLLFFYFFNAVGGERLYSKFIRSYAIDKHKFSGDSGSLMNTAFWISFAVGRLVGLFTGRFIPIRILILLEVFGAMLTSLFLDIFARDSSLALWILTCPMGFFISPLFPSGIGWGDFHVEFTGFAITFALMGGALGGVSYLWIIGYLYEYHGYDMFLHQMLFYGVMMVSFAIIMTFIGKRHGGRYDIKMAEDQTCEHEELKNQKTEEYEC